MKLLIFTQKVDINDDILGFFHGWILEFAKHYEKVIVFCLYKGVYDLPENVKVLSLGKEEGVSKFKYILNFYKYIWSERNNYDKVFVHMNQEYVLLGGFLWKILNKDVSMWRNHPTGGILTKLAIFLCDKTFCTSKFSFTAKFKKNKIMPVGIDTEKFKINSSLQREKRSILSIGRIDPIKKINLLIEASKKIDIDFVLNIYGKGNNKYVENLKREVKDLGQKVVFHGSIPNHDTPRIYNQNQIFVNLTKSGSFDKTILEAMACGCLPLVCNESLRDILDDRFIFNDVSDLSKKIVFLINISDLERDKNIGKFKKYVEDRHSLNKLAEKILKNI